MAAVAATTALSALALASSILAWSAAALACALCLAVSGLRTASGFGRRAALAGVGTLVVVGIGIPACIGVGGAARAVVQGLREGSAARAAVVAAAITFGCCLYAAQRWPDHWPERRFLVAGLILFGAGKLAYVGLVHAQATSDFARLWELAKLSPGLMPAAFPGGSPMTVIFQQRILLYFLPLRFLFGTSTAAYTIANALLTLATSYLIYRMTREWFGLVAARTAFVISLLALEPWLAAGIPTHDLPGTFFTVVALAVLARLVPQLSAGHHGAAGTTALAFGALALLTEVQRSTGSFMLVTGILLSCLSYAFDHPRGRQRGARWLPWVVLVVLPMGTYALGSWLLHARGLMVPASAMAERRGMRLAAGSAPWSDGTWWQFEEGFRRRYVDTRVDWRRLVVAELAAEPELDRWARPRVYLRKSGALFALGTQQYFYLAGAQVVGLGAIAPAVESALRAANAAISLLFLVGLAAGTWLVLRSRPLFTTLTPLVFLATISALLVFGGETQPRYVFPIWYLGAIYAGCAFGRPANRPPERLPQPCDTTP